MNARRVAVSSTDWLDGLCPSAEQIQQTKEHQQRNSDDKRSLCNMQKVPRKLRQRNVGKYLTDLGALKVMVRVNYRRILARQEEIRDAGLDCQLRGEERKQNKRDS